MESTITNSEDSNMDNENGYEINLASRWSRLGAALVDALTIIPITIPLMYFTGGFDRISEGVQPPLSYTLIMAVIGIAIFLIIHGKFLIRDGQTLGKKLLNIKIVTTSGHHASISILAKRYGFYWVIPQVPVAGPFVNLINILFILGKSKRCVHDYVGGTIVITANKQSQADA